MRTSIPLADRRRHRVIVGFVIASQLTSAAMSGGAATAQAPATTQTPAQRNDQTQAGRHSLRVRYGFSASAITDSTQAAVHFHYGAEHITMIDGTLALALGDKVDYSKIIYYGPGSFINIPAGAPHFEWMQSAVDAHVEWIGPTTTVWVDSTRQGRGSGMTDPANTPMRPRPVGPASGLKPWRGHLMWLDGDTASTTALIAFRVRYPAGHDSTKAIPRVLLATQTIVVLSGTFAIGFANAVDYTTVKYYGPGTVIEIPVARPFFAWTSKNFVGHIESVGSLQSIAVNPQTGRPDGKRFFPW